MPELVNIEPSTNPKKKWTATFVLDNGRNKTVHFGDANAEDYTQHGSKSRRNLYRARHEKDLRTNDPMRPGYLSYFILWGNSKNINKNILHYKNEFDL